MASSYPSSSSKQHRRRSSSQISSASNEIALFSRIASFDDDNNSIISLHEEEFFDEEKLLKQDGDDDDGTMMMRRGLVEYCDDLKGCGTCSTGATTFEDEENGRSAAEDVNHDIVDTGEESSSLLFPPAGVRWFARSFSFSITSNNNDNDDDTTIMRGPCCHFVLSRAKSNPALSLVATILIVIFTIYLLTLEQFHKINILRTAFGSKMHTKKQSFSINRNHSYPLEYPPFPAKALLGITVNTTTTTTAVYDSPYNPSDFQYQNEVGMKRTLIYWEDVVAAIEESQEENTINNVDVKDYEEPSNESSSIVVTTPWTNITSWGPCFPRALRDDNNVRSLLKKKRKKKQPISRNWTYIVQNNADIATDDETNINYPTYQRRYSNTEEEYLGGLCRPGYLIIGQGKCGTSSLYHYLTGHDRVLPAVQKQIHYFIFHANKVSVLERCVISAH